MEDVFVERPSKVKMSQNKHEPWREIAEAILNEKDPEYLSQLVTRLCDVFDSEKAAQSPKLKSLQTD